VSKLKVVVATGGFDPVHSGHLAYLKEARLLGDMLIVGLNSDAWLERKKGRAFMPWQERFALLNSLSMVDSVINFVDDDGTACDALYKVQAEYPDAQVIFANGGDRNAGNIPEISVSEVRCVFGVGGHNKANSSSWILEEWKAPKTPRAWGYYRVLHDVAGTKVKELTINPRQSLSMQRHEHRHELWHVIEGACEVKQTLASEYNLPLVTLSRHSQIVIPKGGWHQINNPFDVPCKIVEIQYGTACDEEDITRR
jgi:cytidyltransferase-like protein